MRDTGPRHSQTNQLHTAAASSDSALSVPQACLNNAVGHVWTYSIFSLSNVNLEYQHAVAVNNYMRPIMVAFQSRQITGGKTEDNCKTGFKSQTILRLSLNGNKLCSLIKCFSLQLFLLLVVEPTASGKIIHSILVTKQKVKTWVSQAIHITKFR